MVIITSNQIKMKRLTSIPIILVALFLFQHINVVARNASLDGKWSGTFMDQFQINFIFTSTGSGHYSGRLTMFDGAHQIQDDALTKIVLTGNNLKFYIRAKSTYFNGTVDLWLNQIEGKFTFPDGSLHPVRVSKMLDGEQPSKPSQFEMLYAELPGELFKYDIYFLHAKLSEFHPNLYAYTNESEFQNLTKDIAASLNATESINQFYNQIAPLTDVVGCSHTGIRLPMDMEADLKQKGNYLPLRLFFKDDKAFYVEGFKNGKLKPGFEVVEINGRLMSEIIDEVFIFIPAEGRKQSTKYNEINLRFPEFFLILDNAEKFEIGYVNNDNQKREKVVVPACNRSDFEKLYYKRSHDLDHDFPISFHEVRSFDAAVLKIASFGIRDVNHYIHFMDSIFTLMNDKVIDNLIIDLRNNSGGHPIFAAQLLSYLVDKPFAYFDPKFSKIEEFAPLYTELQPNPIHFDGKCYILVNGGCLSTTGHFISLMKYHDLATFIGEEPGSTFTCNDNSKQFVLPNSGIEVNIPTTVFSTAVDPSIFNKKIVNIPVVINMSDILNTDDKYIETTFRHIQKMDLAN